MRLDKTMGSENDDETRKQEIQTSIFNLDA